MRLLVVMLVAAACGENEHHGGGVFQFLPTTAEQRTSESGGTTSFTVALSDTPDGEIVVSLTSTNLREGTVAPAELVMTPTSHEPQLVTVTGVDDPYVDGPQLYQIVCTAKGSAIPIESASIGIFNDDNDVAGAVATPSHGLITSEAGLAATFTLHLTAKPRENVRLPVASANPAEGVTAIDRVTFTPSDWDLDQTVTVTGVDDAIADGAQPYAITLGPATSLDPAYDGLVPPPVGATNVDDDLEAIVVVPTTGLVTTEAGGGDHFAVVLATQPTADVTIAVAPQPASEVATRPSALVFTSANWSQPQRVEVTGLDDLIVDGDRDFTIVLAPAVSADPRYNNLDPADVFGTNLDDDTAGIVAVPSSGLVTSERGTTDHFAVTLHSQPIAPVTVPIASNDPTEGTVYPATLDFTPATWNIAQTVTVRGVDDAIADGPIAYLVWLGPATSTDLVYAGLVAAPVLVTNLDNDTAGFVIDPASVTVSEFGDSDTVSITLAKRPTATVRMNLSSSDVSEGFVAPAQLVFTVGNWNQAHIVTVTGVDDLLVDGNQAFTIVTAPATSTDPAYNGLDAPDLAAINIDNETAQVYVKAKPLLTTTESGARATYQVRLTLAPTANVVCPVTSSDPSEGIANPAGVAFTPGSFGFQTVTITGIDDAIPDGDQLYDILDGACASADPRYSTADPPDVHVVNRDND
ncbi:MAG: Calx-beta domain-containing protein [Kofleriaceae bacterium]